jgi:hypothetical protein
VDRETGRPVEQFAAAVETNNIIPSRKLNSFFDHEGQFEIKNVTFPQSPVKNDLVGGILLSPLGINGV